MGARKIFGEVFRGIKNRTKKQTKKKPNKYNILVRASEASEETFLVEAYCLKGIISEQEASRDKRLEKNWSSLKFMNNRKTKFEKLSPKNDIYAINIYTYNRR